MKRLAGRKAWSAVEGLLLLASGTTSLQGESRCVGAVRSSAAALHSRAPVRGLWATGCTVRQKGAMPCGAGEHRQRRALRGRRSLVLVAPADDEMLRRLELRLPPVRRRASPALQRRLPPLVPARRRQPCGRNRYDLAVSRQPRAVRSTKRQIGSRHAMARFGGGPGRGRGWPGPTELRAYRRRCSPRWRPASCAGGSSPGSPATPPP
jgi:hypothetical protein